MLINICSFSESNQDSNTLILFKNLSKEKQLEYSKECIPLLFSLTKHTSIYIDSIFVLDGLLKGISEYSFESTTISYTLVLKDYIRSEVTELEFRNFLNLSKK